MLLTDKAEARTDVQRAVIERLYLTGTESFADLRGRADDRTWDEKKTKTSAYGPVRPVGRRFWCPRRRCEVRGKSSGRVRRKNSRSKKAFAFNLPFYGKYITFWSITFDQIADPRDNFIT